MTTRAKLILAAVLYVVGLAVWFYIGYRMGKEN